MTSVLWCMHACVCLCVLDESLFHSVADGQAGSQTAGSQTAGSQTAGSHTARSHTARSHTARSHTARSHTAVAAVCKHFQLLILVHC